jgi:hypothetical protein
LRRWLQRIKVYKNVTYKLEEIMEDIDRSWSGFYKISGISQFIAIISGIIGYVLYFAQGQRVFLPIADQLEILSKHHVLFQLSIGFFNFCAIIYILGALGVYLSLYRLNKNLILPGTVFIILGTALGFGLRFVDLGWVNLAINYANAKNENLQISYVAAAELIRSVTSSGLNFSNLFACVGNLIAGIAMLAGVFSKKTAYLFIISSSLSIICNLCLIFNNLMYFYIILLAPALILGIIARSLIGIRLIALGKQVEQKQE